jgi:hypothetical protein
MDETQVIYRKFYVSMAADLLGVYIEYEATSRKAVNQYLEREYFRNGVWKIPWCAIYEKIPSCFHLQGPIIVKPTCGTLDEEYENG